MEKRSVGHCSAQGSLVGLRLLSLATDETADPLDECCSFRFPVDESRAVVQDWKFSVIDGRRIRAEVKEKEEAKEMYTFDPLASRLTAALGELPQSGTCSLALRGGQAPSSAADASYIIGL